MSSFTIIGAGQSGLLLGIGLRQRGHEVTIVSNRQPEDIGAGRVMSTNCLFGTAYAIERDMGLDFWDDTCPRLEGFRVLIIGPDGTPAVDWQARGEGYGQAVDQRVKYPRFMAHFAELGGTIEYRHADIEALEQYARDSDLVVVATGKSELARIFARDDAHSPYRQPQRSLALVCVRGMEQLGASQLVSFNAWPGVGEIFAIPGYNDGPYHHLLFECVPGGPLDQVWADAESGEDYLAAALSALRRWLPWEAERCANVTLVDDRAYLRGRIVPEIRDPVGRLPSGAVVLGLADAVVLNDPLLGQGANNATKSAATYLAQIDAHEDQTFDESWMRSTFAAAWQYSQWPTQWTNAMLQVPLPDPMMQLVAIAGSDPEVARTFVKCFDRPEEIVPMLSDPDVLQGLGVDLSGAASS